MILYSQLFYLFKLLFTGGINTPYKIQNKFIEKHHINSDLFNASFNKDIKRFPVNIYTSMHLFPIVILREKNIFKKYKADEVKRYVYHRRNTKSKNKKNRYIKYNWLRTNFNLFRKKIKFFFLNRRVRNYLIIKNKIKRDFIKCKDIGYTKKVSNNNKSRYIKTFIKRGGIFGGLRLKRNCVWNNKNISKVYYKIGTHSFNFLMKSRNKYNYNGYKVRTNYKPSLFDISNKRRKLLDLYNNLYKSNKKHNIYLVDKKRDNTRVPSNLYYHKLFRIKNTISHRGSAALNLKQLQKRHIGRLLKHYNNIMFLFRKKKRQSYLFKKKFISKKLTKRRIRAQRFSIKKLKYKLNKNIKYHKLYRTYTPSIQKIGYNFSKRIKESNFRYVSILPNMYLKRINYVKQLLPYNKNEKQLQFIHHSICLKQIHYFKFKYGIRKNLISYLDFANNANLYLNFKSIVLYNFILCNIYIHYIYVYLCNQFLLYSVISLYYNKIYNFDNRKKKISFLSKYYIKHKLLSLKKKCVNNKSQIFWHLIFKNIFFNYIINRFMYSGKKEKMEKIFFSILSTLKRKIKVQPIPFMIKLFDLMLPIFDVYYVRRYRKMQPVPRLLRSRRRLLILFSMLKTVLKEKKKVWYFKNRFVLELLRSNYKRSSIYKKIINFQRYIYNIRRNLYFTRKLKRKAKVFI